MAANAFPLNIPGIFDMRGLISVLLLVAAVLLSPLRAAAQGWTDQPFDPSTMSREDTATLQAALAFSQDYFGFIDGVWTDDADAALKAWVQRERGHPVPTYRDLEDLILDLEDERVANGWQLYYDESANISYLHPFKLLKEVENADVLEFLSEDEGFSMIVRYDDLGGMKSVHEWFRGKAKAGTDPYLYDDKTLWITSATIDNDFIAYARSDLNKGTWATLSIVVEQGYFSHLNLLAASVTVGGSPATLIWTEGGVIDQVVNGDGSGSAPPIAASEPGDPKDQVLRPRPPGVEEVPDAPPVDDPSGPDTVEVAGVTPGPAPGGAPAEGGLGTPAPGSEPAVDAPAADPGKGALGTPAPGADTTEPPTPGNPLGTPAPGGTGAAPADPGGDTAAATPAAPREKVSGTVKSSGSGFYIGPTVLVTAAHVVEGCRAVAMIDGTPLDVMAADSTLDVAVLSGATDAGVWLKLSALEVPKLGETVTALGFPYYTSLDQGLTVTSGNVSALRGADGSSNRVMITAPVQPGNSGGPLLNKKGAVIGVVVSRMDDIAVLEETGSLPQNMNFAVPSGPLLTFLAQNRITRPQGAGSGAEMSGEVPEGVARAVVPLHCYQ